MVGEEEGNSVVQPRRHVHLEHRVQGELGSSHTEVMVSGLAEVDVEKRADVLVFP